MLTEVFADKKLHHHAYLVCGEPDRALDEIEHYFDTRLHFPRRGNPDFWVGRFDTFGVEEGKNISRMHALTSSSGGMKVFVIVADFFTTEAQNALLKMFEEPPAHTHFFIVMKNPDVLLPTLRSRLFVVDAGGASDGGLHEMPDEDVVPRAETYMRASAPKRLSLLKDIIDSKDKMQAVRFVEALEIFFAAQVRQAGNDKPEKYAQEIKSIVNAKRYLYGRAPSVKMILEHLSLTLPQMEDGVKNQ